jgi:hypothetical protein
MPYVLVHVRHSYASYRQSPYVVTFHADPTELDRSYCSREKMLPTPPLNLAEWPVGHALISLPTQLLKQ